ncbi:MAG: biopolymer transporter ExbD [Saprospiraceae bacterium]|nr:biopolymer transporter ExbD [Saprospiraceae bacterium]
MAKAKIARKSTAIDMTAMCDVAFLLLTFFILTTKFRPQELAQINIPASTAQIPIPDANILLIQVSDKGKVYVGVDDQNTRGLWLDKIVERYQLPKPTAAQVANFKLMDAFGVPAERIPELIGAKADQLAKIEQPGILMDSLNNQLGDLVRMARIVNNDLRIAIKCDGATDYDKVDKVIQTLQDQKVNKFNLITSARTSGEAKE